MRASEVLVLAIMLISFVFACMIIPYCMNEYQLPIYFRTTNSNVYLDFLRMRIVAFFYFIVMSGCLPHLQLYNTGSEFKCLSTSSPYVNLEWIDS